MKKIVFVIIGFFNGGLERRVTNLSNELVKSGYSVEIAAVRGVSDTPFFELDKRVKLVDINEKQNTFRYVDFSEEKTSGANAPAAEVSALDHYEESSFKGNGLKKKIRKTAAFFIKNSILFRKANNSRYSAVYKDYFQKASPDIVVSFGVNFHERVLSAAKGFDFKIFDAEINAHQSVIPQDRVRRKSYFNLFKKVDGIIVQTQSEKEYFQKKFKNIYVINNPIKPDLPLADKVKREKVIVNFCRITPQKNLSLLLEAFCRFHNEYPDYILKIYGNVQQQMEIDEKNILVKRISELNISDCAFVLPPAPDVHKKIIDSAMYVSSSDFEGLSNSMLEAMAIGLPCICTDCMGGGTREVMTDRENGLIVPMNDADAMYRAMKEFIENPELAEKCSQNAIKIREKLSVEKITRQWLEVIEK